MKPDLKNLATNADEGEYGTKSSGFAGGGPFSCSNCVHMKQIKQRNVCQHPITNADPELKDRERLNGLLEVDWDDCCTFVRPHDAE